METLELPVIEDSEQGSPWPGGPPVDFAEQEMDPAVFKLWREASLPDAAEETA